MRRTKLLMTLLGVAAILAFTRMPARADSAQDNYTAYCAKCHGADGRGDGPSAASLATKPQDYTDCAAMQKISDDTMFKVIKGGGARPACRVTCRAGATGCPTRKFTTWWLTFAPFARRNSRSRAAATIPDCSCARAELFIDEQRQEGKAAAFRLTHESRRDMISSDTYSVCARVRSLSDLMRAVVASSS